MLIMNLFEFLLCWLGIYMNFCHADYEFIWIFVMLIMNLLCYADYEIIYATLIMNLFEFIILCWLWIYFNLWRHLCWSQMSYSLLI